MNGMPYFLPSQVPTSMPAGATFSMPGMRSMWSVRSVNSPADVQFGMNTTSAENRSGSAVRGRGGADLGLVVVGDD